MYETKIELNKLNKAQELLNVIHTQKKQIKDLRIKTDDLNHRMLMYKNYNLQIVDMYNDLIPQDKRLNPREFIIDQSKMNPSSVFMK